jgi:tetratricopeptide (TPR) repeat protein
MRGTILAAVLLVAVQAPPPRSTTSVDEQRAKQHDQAGWKALEGGHADKALTEFHAALQINPGYADALHGLGKANMALQRYPDAVSALERCRESYLHGGSADAERRLIETNARQAQIAKLKDELQRARQNPDQSSGANNYYANLTQQIRDLEAVRDPGPVVTEEGAVPPFISLALGSAYFRVDRMADAEHMFREAIAADPKFGEAHSNLALVCLLTGRAKEADEHIRIAEEAKFKVNPELKRRVHEALGKGES